MTVKNELDTQSAQYLCQLTVSERIFPLLSTMVAKHLTNPLATVDQLYRRTFAFGALPSDLQDAIFFSTQRLTQAAGLLLRLPQSVTAQASVVLARYWLGDELLANEFSVREMDMLYPELLFLAVKAKLE
jgi:hypothetical protein